MRSKATKRRSKESASLLRTEGYRRENHRSDFTLDGRRSGVRSSSRSFVTAKSNVANDRGSGSVVVDNDHDDDDEEANLDYKDSVPLNKQKRKSPLRHIFPKTWFGCRRAGSVLNSVVPSTGPSRTPSPTRRRHSRHSNNGVSLSPLHVVDFVPSQFHNRDEKDAVVPDAPSSPRFRIAADGESRLDDGGSPMSYRKMREQFIFRQREQKEEHDKTEEEKQEKERQKQEQRQLKEQEEQQRQEERQKRIQHQRHQRQKRIQNLKQQQQHQQEQNEQQQEEQHQEDMLLRKQQEQQHLLLRQQEELIQRQQQQLLAQQQLLLQQQEQQQQQQQQLQLHLQQRISSPNVVENAIFTPPRLVRSHDPVSACEASDDHDGGDCDDNDEEDRSSEEDVADMIVDKDTDSHNDDDIDMDMDIVVDEDEEFSMPKSPPHLVRTTRDDHDDDEEESDGNDDGNNDATETTKMTTSTSNSTALITTTNASPRALTFREIRELRLEQERLKQQDQLGLVEQQSESSPTSVAMVPRAMIQRWDHHNFSPKTEYEHDSLSSSQRARDSWKNRISDQQR